MDAHEFGTTGNFTDRVDISMAGVLRDCAECHVGGGANEYVIDLNATKRIPFRNMTSSGQLAQGSFTVDASSVTAFNYFIDIYDEDGDGNKTEPLTQSFYRTGVLEMDCFMCHFQGYDWEARKDELRKGRFDASRVVGAGLGRAIADRVGDDWDGNIYGRLVSYDDTKILVDHLNGDALYLAPYVAMAIKGTPPASNCASCHFNAHQVDWKKRGATWGMDYENEVHARLGCMGCHKRTEDAAVGTDGKASSSLLGQCDPAKGNVPFSSLWNANDNTGLRTCEYCHLDHEGGFFGLTAPDPTDKHYRAGLAADIIGDNSTTPTKSHLDIIHCSACHARKLGTGTGAAMVDATGPDAEGRLTDHESHTIERDMQDNLAYTWSKTTGKLIASHILTTMFVKDVDGSFDLNNDGRAGGMDPLLQTHMLALGLDPLTHDGNVTNSDASSYLSAVSTKYGGNPKLTFMSVPFQVTHNIAPASVALGANGCNDCHGGSAGVLGGAGMFSSTYDIGPRDTVFSLDANGTGSVVAPFTKLGGTVPTDFHPNLVGKDGKSINLRVMSGDSSDLAVLNRWQMMYDVDETYVGAHGCTSGCNATEWVDYLNSINGNAAHGVPPTIEAISCNGTTATLNWDANNATIIIGDIGQKVMALVCDVNATDIDLTGSSTAMSLDSTNTQWRIVPGSARPLQKVLNGEQVTINFPAGADNNATIEVTVYVRDSEKLMSFKNVTVVIE